MEKSSQTYSKPKLLMVVSRFPYPLEKGDKLRAYHQLSVLKDFFDITLLAISDVDPEPEHIKKVTEFCQELHIIRQSKWQKIWQIGLAILNGQPLQVGYFYIPKARKKVKSILQNKDFKYSYCQLIRCSEYLKNEHFVIKTIDYQDAFSKGVERRIENASLLWKPILKMEFKRLRQYESRMFDFFEHKTIISSQDRDFILHPDNHKIQCIPNGIDDSFFEKVEGIQTHEFVFVGNMSYAPNVEAVEYIVKEILPVFPHAKLLIAGSSPHPRVKKLQQLGKVEITGWVDDIRDAYIRGQIFLAPMMIGTGMQNKLLEAMALGIPCVTTSLANNAIGAVHGESIMVGDTKDQIISGIQSLQNDLELCDYIAENAKRFVKEKYNWKSATLPLVELIQKC